MNKEDKTTNSNITQDDLNALGEKTQNLREDGGADSVLNERENPIDFAGSDLDVPGRTLPTNQNPSNLKDEENQLYSQGGDGNGHLESDTLRP